MVREPPAVYTEIAPLEHQAAVIDHLFVIRDNGWLTGGGRHRFASPFSEVRYAKLASDEQGTDKWRGSVSGAALRIRARRRPVVGCIAGLRIDADLSGVALPLFAAGDGCGSLDRVVHALDAAADAIVGQLRRMPVAQPSVLFESRYRANRLAQALGLSGRTLRRHLRSATGTAPKTWLSLHRFRSAVRELARGDVGLSGLALDHGYCDQAHLTADFARRAGITPGRLMARAAAELGVDPGRFFQDEAIVRRIGLLLTRRPEECSHDIPAQGPSLS